MPKRQTPAKYDVAVLETLILEVAAELHPNNLSTDALLLRFVSDPDDARETETGTQAIRNLRGCGLLSGREAEIVQPTPAALRAVALLT